MSEIAITNGRVRFERAEDGGTPAELMARFGATIGPNGITLTIQAPVGSLSFTLETTDRRTIYFFSQFDGALRAVQRRMEPVTSEFKAPRPPYRELRRGYFLCTLCDGVLPDCELCDGIGHVTERALEQWMVDNGTLMGGDDA